MQTLEEKILELKEQIKNCKSQLKALFLIEDVTEFQEQIKLRCHKVELEDQLDKLLEENAAEEWIEGWG